MALVGLRLRVRLNRAWSIDATRFDIVNVLNKSNEPRKKRFYRAIFVGD